MRAQKMDYLSAIEVFRDLSQQDMAEMDRQTTMCTCTSGKIFYSPNDRLEVLFLLKRGRVQLYRISPDGKKLVVVTLGPNSIFGEMTIIGQGMQDTYAEALEDCLLCVMSRADIERLILMRPQVALRFVEAMGRRLMQVENRLEEMAFKSVPARLASLLLQLAEKDGSTLAVTGYTHQALAEMLGTYRETTTQTLNEFKTQKLIDIGRKRIDILNPAGLEQFAEGSGEPVPALAGKR